MSKPTVPRSEDFRRENAMGSSPVIGPTMGGISSGGQTSRRSGRRSTARRRASFQEVGLVQVDQLRAGEHGEDAAQRQKDAEGNGLLARRGALPRNDHETDQGAAEKSHE